MPAVFSCNLSQEVCVIASHEERITLSVRYRIYQHPYIVTIGDEMTLKETDLS